jgi:U3 small nucleolar RNA-associated protein 15
MMTDILFSFLYLLGLLSGGNVIKVWDALAGGRLLTTLCHHHKTITTLSFCKNYRRLISGSIDR